jgi:hypothetical protein
MLFLKTLNPSAGGIGSILNDPSPTLRLNPNVAIVVMNPVAGENWSRIRSWRMQD